MDALLLMAAIALVVVIGLVIVALLLTRRPAPPETRDDQLRAGVDPTTDIGTATDRATGTTAWMRPGGGGV